MLQCSDDTLDMKHIAFPIPHHAMDEEGEEEEEEASFRMQQRRRAGLAHRSGGKLFIHLLVCSQERMR